MLVLTQKEVKLIKSPSKLAEKMQSNVVRGQALGMRGTQVLALTQKAETD